jgi:hypothetical protein
MILAIPPRLQWAGNFGYCGETAMISAGLFFGQYVSQYNARTLASPGLDQSREGSQLLVGPDQNDQRAAGGMRLAFLEYDTEGGQSTQDFLGWVKGQVLSGFPVVIGLYMNQHLFYPGLKRKGDSEYDHIVPVVGIESPHPLSDAGYHDDDVIVFHDNGLCPPDGSQPRVFTFRSEFKSFPRTRHGANLPASPPYSLALRSTGVGNYGIAIRGVQTDGSTLPIQVATSFPYERPEIVDGSADRPMPMRLTLTITATGLETGVRYNLYRYNRLESVPTVSFNKHASSASASWILTSSNPIHQENIMSDEVAAYRLVSASAP